MWSLVLSSAFVSILGLFFIICWCLFLFSDTDDTVFGLSTFECGYDVRYVTLETVELQVLFVIILFVMFDCELFVLLFWIITGVFTIFLIGVYFVIIGLFMLATFIEVLLRFY